MDVSSDAQPNLAVGHVFSRAWRAFKDRPWLAMAVALVSAILGNLPQVMPADSELTSPTRFVVFVLVQPALLIGVYRVALAIARDEDAEFFMMFDGFTRWLRSVGVFWLYTAIVTVGTLMLVVPGVIWALGFAPVFFTVMDADHGVVESLRRTWRMTAGYKGKLFLIMLAVGGLNMLGVFAFLVGVVITLALTNVVYAVAYDELTKRSPDSETIADLDEALAA